MISFQLPTDRVDYLQIAFPESPSGLVVRWGTQFTPFTVAAWDDLKKPPRWKLVGPDLHLSPDGGWVSVFDKDKFHLRITKVGESATPIRITCPKQTIHVWTAVAPGGHAVAWKGNDGSEKLYVNVQSLPESALLARIKTGWGSELRFASGGRWLTERGERVYRVFDATNKYRPFARIKTLRHTIAEIADVPMAVTTAPTRSQVAVWDLDPVAERAALDVGGWISALAIAPDGRKVLVGNTAGKLLLWDIVSGHQQQYDWGLTVPLGAVFSRDGTRVAVGSQTGRIVIWDLDD